MLYIYIFQILMIHWPTWNFRTEARLQAKLEATSADTKEQNTRSAAEQVETIRRGV